MARPKPRLGGGPKVGIISQSLQPLVNDAHGQFGQRVTHRKSPVIVRVPPIALLFKKGNHLDGPPCPGGGTTRNAQIQETGKWCKGLPRQVLDHLGG